MGPIKKIADIVPELKKVQKKFNIGKGEWILGYGYDANLLEEKRQVTRDDLDPHFPDNPVLLMHVSGHGAVLNSAGLQKVGITAATPTPAGGVILRKPGSDEPEGLLMETAFLPIMTKMPQPSEDALLGLFKEAQAIYARAGVTTAQEGATIAKDVALLQKAAAQGRLFIDLVSYPIVVELKEVLAHYPPGSFGRYKNRLKLGGTKAFIDGSPQGKTAFMTKPYLTGGPAGQKDWRGEPTFPQETLNQLVKPAYDNNLQLLCHANGDAAIDMVLAAHEFAAGDNKALDRRTTVIHSQFVRRDQLEKYVKYNFIASLFTEHAFFHGDVHAQNLGKERAYFLSPLKTATGMGLHCTNHTDFNVCPIDQLWTIWTAVNRTSRSGAVIGPEERVTPLQALKAITTEAAYQYREEATKGSIEEGKLADLVILSANPLKAKPDGIKDIKVLETIKEGKTVYSSEEEAVEAA